MPARPAPGAVWPLLHPTGAGVGRCLPGVLRSRQDPERGPCTRPRTPHAPLGPQRRAEINDLLTGDQAVSIIDSPGPAPRTATAVILTTVEPGREEAFRRWNAEITAAQSRQSGYVGATLQAPVEGVQDQWVTMVTFDLLWFSPLGEKVGIWRWPT